MGVGHFFNFQCNVNKPFLSSQTSFSHQSPVSCFSLYLHIALKWVLTASSTWLYTWQSSCHQINRNWCICQVLSCPFPAKDCSSQVIFLAGAASGDFAPLKVLVATSSTAWQFVKQSSTLDQGTIQRDQHLERSINNIVSKLGFSRILPSVFTDCYVNVLWIWNGFHMPDKLTYSSKGQLDLRMQGISSVLITNAMWLNKQLSPERYLCQPSSHHDAYIM